jgi:hypothetical protein
MDYNDKLNTHRVVTYYMNSNNQMSRRVFENLNHSEAMEHVKAHKQHHVKVYNYLGHLVHETQPGSVAIETYA